MILCLRYEGLLGSPLNMEGSTSNKNWKPSEWQVGGQRMNTSYDKLKEFYANNIIHQTLENKNKTGILDTGETGHYLQVGAPHSLKTNIGPPISVGWPNVQTIQSIKPCLIYFPSLPEEAREGHIIPSLTHSSLVSTGKLCDAGFTAYFKA